MAGSDRIVLKRFRALGLALLAVGLLASSWIYARSFPSEAELAPGEIARYELVGGQLFPLKAENDKAYQGASNVLFGPAGGEVTKLRIWLRSLWHGRKLAYTLLFISIGACSACLYLGDFLSYPLLTNGAKPSSQLPWAAVRKQD